MDDNSIGNPQKVEAEILRFTLIDPVPNEVETSLRKKINDDFVKRHNNGACAGRLEYWSAHHLGSHRGDRIAIFTGCTCHESANG